MKYFDNKYILLYTLYCDTFQSDHFEVFLFEQFEQECILVQ